MVSGLDKDSANSGATTRNPDAASASAMSTKSNRLEGTTVVLFVRLFVFVVIVLCCAVLCFLDSPSAAKGETAPVDVSYSFVEREKRTHKGFRSKGRMTKHSDEVRGE